MNLLPPPRRSGEKQPSARHADGVPRDYRLTRYTLATVNILTLGINYWPETSGIGPFTTGRCEYLARQGHSVTVCTTFPYYPSWRTDDNRRRFRATEVHNGVTLRRIRIYVPTNPTPVRRILHEGSFIAAALANSIRISPPDVIITVSPPLGLAVAAITLARKWHAPYLLHVTDLQPDAALELGMLRPGAATRMLYTLERIAYRNAAMVSTLTGAMRRRLLAKGLSDHKLTLAPDWADDSLFEVAIGEKPGAFKAHHGFENRTLVVHAGNMGVKQGLEVIVKAAALARTQAPEVMFLLVGDGAQRARLEREQQALELENLRFMPLLPRSEFHKLLADSDICIISQQRCVADNVFPSKTITLLAAARPIVASLSPNSEVATVLRESGAGIRCEAEDPRALLDAITTLAHDRAQRHRMGLAGRAWAARHWSRDTGLRLFEAGLMRMAASANSETDSRAAPSVPA